MAIKKLCIVPTVHEAHPVFMERMALLVIMLFALQAYQTRLRKIMDASQNSTDAASVLFIETLDESEQEIFAAGQQGLADFLQWETRHSDQITSSDMVANLKKRKRIQMEEH